MLLSVIIPVYNCEKYLECAVNSIIKQPCKDVEVLIIDDGSTDNSNKIADKLSSIHKNVKVFHICNVGVSHARNFGIKRAQGKYIAFLDSDDVWCKDIYNNNIYNLLADNNDISILSLGYIICDETLTNGNYIKAINHIPKTNSYYNNFYDKHFSSNIYSKNIFKKFSFDEKHTYSEDKEFLIKLLCEEIPVVVIDKFLFMYRQNFSSTMHTQNRTNSNYLLTQIKTFCDLYVYCIDKNYKSPNINFCKFEIFNVALSYIEEATIKGFTKSDITNTLSKYIDLSFLKDDLPFNDDRLSYIQTMFFNDFDKYKKETIKNNKFRYIYNKTGLNRIEWLRKLILKPKYNNIVTDFSY